MRVADAQFLLTANHCPVLDPAQLLGLEGHARAFLLAVGVHQFRPLASVGCHQRRIELAFAHVVKQVRRTGDALLHCADA